MVPSTPLVTPDVYLLEWALTRDSILSQNYVSYEWSHHVVPLTNIEALELLFNSHMANNLQYVVTHVSPYLVVVYRHLHHMSSDLAELTIIKDECDEFRERVMGLEEEKRKFKECYDLLVRVKSFCRGPSENLGCGGRAAVSACGCLSNGEGSIRGASEATWKAVGC